MNWIIASLVMFVSSVVMYLFIRKSALLKLPSQYNNLAMFGIPLFVFITIGLFSKQNFIIPFNYLLAIFIISILFSYLGNVFSLISIERSPNPGYSLVISKSYVVFTTILSVLFFNSELSIKKGIAILLIVVFSALIMLSQKSIKKVSNNRWLFLAFGAFFCWGFLSLASKYMFNLGVGLYVFLSYTYLFVSICILIEMHIKKMSLKSFVKNPWQFLLIGLASIGFNLFLFLAIKLAPNVGYVNAINAGSISAVTVLAILLFKDEFSLRKLVGVIGVTAGLLMLLI